MPRGIPNAKPKPADVPLPPAWIEEDGEPVEPAATYPPVAEEAVLFDEGDVIEPDEPIRAITVAGEPATHHLVVGMGTLAAMSEEEFAAKLDVMKRGQARLRTIQEQLLVKGEDYGLVKGIDKPFLHQPGAEKLANFYGLAVEQFAERLVGDGVTSPPLAYHVRSLVHLGDFAGPVVAQGFGESSSWEEKNRYRWSKPACPTCGREGLIRGKKDGPLQGRWWCPGREGGCNSKFEPNATKPDGTLLVEPAHRIDNEDPWSLAETILLMASKRCLSGSTPMLMKLGSRIPNRVGVLASDISYAYQRFIKDRDVWVPTVGGSWTRVVGMVQSPKAPTMRIALADGQSFVASPDHRWPTDEGLVETRDLLPGMSLVREQIDIEAGKAPADPEWGWAAGLFIADGNYPSSKQPDIARYTLNDGTKIEHVARLTRLAQGIGSSVHVTQTVGHTVRVQINGPFEAVLRRFVDGTTSKNRRPSPHAFRQGSAFLAALVDGYLDGDGHKGVNRAKGTRPGTGFTPRWQLGFTRENHFLATSLRHACAVLGYRFALREGFSKLNGEPYPTWNGWIAKEHTTFHPANLSQIVSVEPYHTMHTYDIEVEHPDHVFIIGGGIVTHNSMVSSVRRATGTSGLFTQDPDSPSVRNQVGDIPDAPEPTVEAGPVGIQVSVGAKTTEATQLQHNELARLAKEKGLNGAKIADILNRLFGLDVEPTGKAASDAVKTLDAEQMGRLLRTLVTGEVDERPDGGPQ